MKNKTALSLNQLDIKTLLSVRLLLALNDRKQMLNFGEVQLVFYGIFWYRRTPQ